MQFVRPTIFALSSGRPPVAIAVVRISGGQAAQVLDRMCGRRPAPRTAALVTLRDLQETAIDQAVALWFPGPHSATGEDIVELHVHGGRAVLAAVLNALGQIEGLRPAEPGEFTRQAFENGKLDLTAAEGLDDLIHADTDQQRRQALRHLQGFLGLRAEQWRRRLIEAAALIEATIDFSDEEDVPDDLLGPALADVGALKDEIETALSQSAHSERLRDGLVVAIAGPPNAGKSTLLNRLARRDAAIVSPYAGTTRDVIEVHLDLGGYPVTLLDTAGIRESHDPVEQEGIRRAAARAATADLVLWLSDAAAPSERPAAGGPETWLVLNKIDLVAGRVGAGGAARVFALSAVRGDGFEELLAALVAFARETFGGGEPALISRVRHRDLLTQCSVALGRAIAAREAGIELVAEELRSASHALGRLTGRVDVEDLLDVIFRDFCIGK
jgi:tRNA modification GTPase